MQFALASIALSTISIVTAQHDSIDTGATVSFYGDDFATQGAGLKTALPARNNDLGGNWFLNYYNFGNGFTSNRQIFAYYPSSTIAGDSTCVGVIQGVRGGAPNGNNGGCDSVLGGNGCSQLIIEAIKKGCSPTMFSGLPEACGVLNVETQTVSTGTFTPAQPAVWLTWDYSNNSSAQETLARDLTFPVFARSADGQSANLACLRVDGGAGSVVASMASILFAASTAAYMLL